MQTMIVCLQRLETAKVYKPVKRPNGENEHRILLGRSAGNKSGYDKMKCVTPDIVSAAALQDIQAQLRYWKTTYNQQ